MVRLPRVCFTVRRLMIVVALAALLLGVRGWCVVRSARFREMADRHFRSWLDNPSSVIDSRLPDELEARQSEYHLAMRGKYLRAARYPWLPLAPDPPEPK